ncbi:hypothetical protein NB705_000621 [Xanthomonas sacchari]|nr:hypothetical protein [Xanthomonas sacchari]
MALQRLAGAGRQRLVAGKEVFGQRHDVAGALGQRRQRQFHRVEPVVQVLAEAAVADHRGQVGIGGADHPHLDLPLAVGAEPFEPAGLQHPQQLHLPGQRQVADLVQEQGAAVGGLELALAHLVGAGVGAGLGAEQLGLDQFGRDRAAIERHERAAPYRGVGLDDLRDLLLAAAVGAGDQHRQFRARHLAGQGDRALAGGIGEHCAAQVVALRQLLAMAALAVAAAFQFAAGLGQLQQVVDGGQQLAVVPGLGQVVGGAGLDQLHRAAELGPGGQQDHRQIRMARADRLEQGHAFLAGGGVGGEVHVLQDQIDVALAQALQAGLRAVGMDGVDVVQGEQHFQRGGDRRVVVDDQQAGHRAPWARRDTPAEKNG